MRSYSALVITLLVIFLLQPRLTLGQCEQHLNAKSIKVNEAEKTGSFNLNVATTGSFNGQLILIQGTNEKTIKSFNGNGRRDFTFKDLQLGKDELYRVVVEFGGEGEFLCKRKVLDIEFTNR